MKRLLFLLAAIPAFGTTCAISDTLNNPFGGYFVGKIFVSINSPAAAQPLYSGSVTLSGWQTTVDVPSSANGAVSFSLVCTDTITPAGTSYSARYQPTSGTGWAEVWLPATGTTTIRDMRSVTTPTPTATFTPSQLRLTAGSLAYGAANGYGTSLPIGTSGYVLSSVAGFPAWVSSPACATCVVTGGSYADPAWITSLAGAKISGPVATAMALAANGTNCSAGTFPLGVDASGSSETCTALPTTITGTANQITASASTGAVTLSLPATIAITPVCDGSTDDRAVIQAAITANQSIRIIGKATACMISSPLSIPSNRHISLDHNSTIKLANYALASGGASLAVNSDTSGGNVNIRIEGGTWDGNSANQNRVDVPIVGGVGFRMNNVAGLVIRDVILKDVHTFNIQAGNISSFLFENIRIQCAIPTGNSDGVHIHGPASNGEVRNIIGGCSDDHVALNADDGALYQMTYGAISNVVVDGIFGGASGYRGIRLLSNGSAISNVTIRNITGIFQYGAVLATCYGPTCVDNTVGSYSGILVENIRATYGAQGDDGENAVHVGIGNMGDWTIRNLDVTAYDSGTGSPIGLVGAFTTVYVDSLKLFNSVKDPIYVDGGATYTAIYKTNVSGSNSGLALSAPSLLVTATASGAMGGEVIAENLANAAGDEAALSLRSGLYKRSQLAMKVNSQGGSYCGDVYFRAVPDYLSSLSDRLRLNCYNNAWIYTAGASLTWAPSTTLTASPDLSLSRGAANNLYVGTGAAGNAGGTITAATFVGALTGNASTATAFSTAASGTPASATAACTTGAVKFDASYVYVCHATNTWKRAAVATW